MKVYVIYEKGVFRPSEKVNLPEHQKLIIHFWPEIKHDLDLENDHANKGSNRVSVVPITSSNIAKVYPFEVFLPAKSETGPNYDSKIACDQVRSVDKRRLLKKLGSVSLDTMDGIKAALR